MERTLGQKLRYLRESRHLTQEQVSAHLHIERSTYANYENGKRTPAYPLIVSFANFYHIPVDFLVRDDFTSNPVIRTPEAERFLTAFYQLEPATRAEIIEYTYYRLRKQKVKKMH